MMHYCMFRQDYLIEHGGYGNEDFVVETPVLQEPVSLTPEQTEVRIILKKSVMAKIQILVNEFTDPGFFGLYFLLLLFFWGV